LNSGSTPWVTPTTFFCVWDGFFKIDSHELFALAGFKPRSSWFLPPE
jgi:hypothetical protein